MQAFEMHTVFENVFRARLREKWVCALMNLEVVVGLMCTVDEADNMWIDYDMSEILCLY